MYDKYLPLGTVVLLKEASKKLMIIGFCGVGDEKDKVYDYMGCLYPEGLIDSAHTALFNHDQISKIYFMGYQSEEDKEFKTKLKEVIAKEGK